MKVSIRLTLFPDDDEVKVGKKQGLLILPSLPPVTPLKCRCTKGLRHGRESDCPSRHPPVFQFAPSHFFEIRCKRIRFDALTRI